MMLGRNRSMWREKMIFETSGLFAVLILIADVYAIFNVVPSRKQLGVKAAWITAIMLLPIAGFIAWVLFGPRQPKIDHES